MLKIRKHTLWLTIFAIGFCIGMCQEARGQTDATLAFLNTQNLFDTINTPDTNDGEFTPSGTQHWNSGKYNEKLRMLAAVVGELNADVLGLCEVENRRVVEDLVKTTGLKYDIIHYDSRDSRGIDVCMLFKADKVKIKSSELVGDVVGTREVLKVAISIDNRDAIIYIAHLPSQRGGAKAADKRQQLLSMLQTEVTAHISQNVILMGDMNTDLITVAGLTNLSEKLAKQGYGTYCYQGVWTMLDQILISPSLLPCVQKVAIHNLSRTPYRSPNNKMATDHKAVYFILKM